MTNSATLAAIFTLPPRAITGKSVVDERLERSQRDIASDMRSYLSSVAVVPGSEFVNELLEATGRRLIKYVDSSTYLQLGSLHNSFYVSGMMEILYNHSKEITTEIFAPKEKIDFTSYCERLATQLSHHMHQEQGMGWELAKPLDRCLYGMPIVLPGTMVLGMGLYLTKQQLNHGNLTSPFAHEDGYVCLETVLLKI